MNGRMVGLPVQAVVWTQKRAMAGDAVQSHFGFGEGVLDLLGALEAFVRSWSM